VEEESASAIAEDHEVSVQAKAAAMQLGEIAVERRERRPVSLIGLAERENGSIVEVLLLDLSYEGCGIESPVPLDAGELLKLSVLRRGVIEARVRWYDKGKAGLVFEAEEPAPESESHSPRRSDRVQLTAEVSMRRLGKSGFRVKVFDLSPEGCKLELIDMPRLGEHVLVKFEGLEALESEVCWIAHNCAGLRFEKPIHPAVFDLLLQRVAKAPD
jgi:hypothetical protein